jgi:predicted lipid carrier protein YhbT
MSVSGSAIAKVPQALAFAGRVLPLQPLQPLLGACLDEIRRRHPDIFDRLGPYADKRFGLVPTDLPFAFVLEPSRTNPKVTAVRALPRRIDVKIIGPLAALIALADGSCDGDALFFSRDIQIEGDIEAVVALRNAIDDARIDVIAESVAWLGPLSPIVERLVRGVLAGPVAAASPADLAGGSRWN